MLAHDRRRGVAELGIRQVARRGERAEEQPGRGEHGEDRDQLDREARPRELVAEPERPRLPEQQVARLADDRSGRRRRRGRDGDDGERRRERRARAAAARSTSAERNVPGSCRAVNDDRLAHEQHGAAERSGSASSKSRPLSTLNDGQGEQQRRPRAGARPRGGGTGSTPSRSAPPRPARRARGRCCITPNGSRWTSSRPRQRDVRRDGRERGRRGRRRRSRARRPPGTSSRWRAGPERQRPAVDPEPPRRRCRGRAGVRSGQSLTISQAPSSSATSRRARARSRRAAPRARARTRSRARRGAIRGHAVRGRRREVRGDAARASASGELAWVIGSGQATVDDADRIRRRALEGRL